TPWHPAHRLVGLHVLPVAARSCTQTANPSDDDAVFKVLSYTLHHANPPSVPDKIDLEAIAKVINESGADLVGLQEVDVRTIRSGKSSNQAEALGEKTSMTVFFFNGIE